MPEPPGFVKEGGRIPHRMEVIPKEVREVDASAMLT
jgi:hypothetical protein